MMLEALEVTIKEGQGERDVWQLATGQAQRIYTARPRPLAKGNKLGDMGTIPSLVPGRGGA